MILETIAVIGLFGAGLAYGAKHKEKTRQKLTEDTIEVAGACVNKVCEVTTAVKAKLAAKPCKSA